MTANDASPIRSTKGSRMTEFEKLSAERGLYRVATVHILCIEGRTIERSMFASNFPVDSLYSNIPTLYGAFDEVTKSFSRAERHAMFADTARDIYRISPTLTSRQDVS